MVENFHVLVDNVGKNLYALWEAIKGFLNWMMAGGQQFCEALAYAKLPKEVVAKEMKAIARQADALGELIEDLSCPEVAVPEAAAGAAPANQRSAPAEQTSRRTKGTR
jgi:hypothetical protein